MTRELSQKILDHYHVGKVIELEQVKEHVIKAVTSHDVFWIFDFAPLANYEIKDKEFEFAKTVIGKLNGAEVQLLSYGDYNAITVHAEHGFYSVFKSI